MKISIILGIICFILLIIPITFLCIILSGATVGALEYIYKKIKQFLNNLMKKRNENKQTNRIT